MGENWFQREFLQPRRLAFNVIFYGLHFFFFGYGWHSQVRVFCTVACPRSILNSGALGRQPTLRSPL